MTDSTVDRVLRALEGYDLKQHGATLDGFEKYRCNSPLRPNSNSHAFTLRVKGGELGFWYDHVDHTTGSLYQLASRLGIETPEKAEHTATSKRGYSSMAEYANSHGVPEQILADAGWKETTYKRRSALSFPTRSGTRYRFLDGDIPAYISVLGYSACWYGIKRAVEMARATKQPLVLCNGEISTIAAQYYGIAACAITSGEKAQIPDTLLAELQELYPSGDLLICLDCDTTGRASALGLQQQLTARGYAARALDLGGFDGFDLADFARLYEQDALAALPVLKPLTPPIPATAARPHPIVSLRALLTEEMPPVHWIIPGILAEGAALLLGKPKMGKSFMALAMGIAVTSGGMVLGSMSVERGEVLYLGLEDGRRRLQARSRKILAGAPAPEGMTFATNWKRLDEGGLSDLEAWMTQHPATKLIIIDTLIKVRPSRKRGGDIYEEDYQPLQSLSELANRYHMAILIVHHMRKATADDFLDSASGTTGLTGAVDTVMALQRERGSADAVLSVTGRDIEQETEIALKWDHTTAQWITLGNAEEYRVSQEAKEIIDLLRSKDTAMTPKEIAEALGRSHANTKVLLAKMADRGDVKTSGYGKYIPNTPQVVPIYAQSEVTGYSDYRDYSDNSGYSDYSSEQKAEKPDEQTKSNQGNQGNQSNQSNQSNRSLQVERENISVSDMDLHATVLELLEQGKFSIAKIRAKEIQNLAFRAMTIEKVRQGEIAPL